MFLTSRAIGFFKDLWSLGTSATHTHETIIRYTVLQVRFLRDFARKKSFAGSGIWTHDLLLAGTEPHSFPTFHWKTIHLNDLLVNNLETELVKIKLMVLDHKF